MARDAKGKFVATLDDQVSPGARTAARSLDRLKKKLSKFNSSGIGKAVSKMQDWGKSAVTIGVVATAAVGAAVAGLTVQTVDFAQRSRMAFGLLAKHGEVPEELFQRSIGLAQELGLDVQDTTKQIAKFRALQFSQSGAEDLIKMGADMQALGASSEEVTRIFSQLGQIQAKGKLQGEELIVLAENGLSTQLVYENLEKQLGKTRDEILKMQQAGDIKSDVAFKAIGAAILQKTGTKQFGQAGKMAATATMEGMLRVFKSQVQGMFIQLADEVGPDVKDAFAGILAEFQDFGSGANLFDRTADALKGIAEAARKAAPLVKVFVEGFASGVMTGVMDSINGVNRALDKMTDADVEKFGKQLGTVLGKIIWAFSKAADVAAFFTSPLGRVAFWLGAVFLVGAKVAGWALTAASAFNTASAAIRGLMAARAVASAMTALSAAGPAAAAGTTAAGAAATTASAGFWVLAAPILAIAAALAAAVLAYQQWKALKAEMGGSFDGLLSGDVFGAVDARMNEQARLRAQMRDDGQAAGAELGAGMAAGINASTAQAAAAAAAMGNGVVAATDQSLQIHSPSKVMEDRGEMTAAGFIRGLDSMPMPFLNSPSLGSDSGPSRAAGIAAGGAAAASSSGGGNSFTFAPVIHASVQPGATKADGKAFGEGLSGSLRTQYLAFQEDLLIEQGLQGA
jgi:tape measure domain-containing protein